MLASLLEADQLASAGFDDETWMDFVERVVEALDVGPGTTVWDAGCGAGSFLYPLSLNHYVVGGVDPSVDRIALARAAMPAARLAVGPVLDFNPAEAWDVVVASGGLSACRDADDVRALLARMAARATHAIALLRVDEEAGPGVGRGELLRMLAEIGVSAVRFEQSDDARLQVFARVAGSRR